jgi:uncharacterized membrane protein YphA (DoxX/SURF4 family)
MQIKSELSKEVKPWLATLQNLCLGYTDDLNGLATDEQAKRGPVTLPTPGARLFDSRFIDAIIPTFDLIVGICLMLGLLTRLNCLAGAGFLATIIATQWPTNPWAVPAHYQIVELFALLVLAAFAAGRFAGLDVLLGYLRLKCCPPKTEKK